MDGDKVRSESRKILNEITNDTFITNNLEKGVFNYAIWKTKSRHHQCNWDTIPFADAYRNKLKQVCSNLIPNSYVGNTHLLQRLKEKEFKPHEIAFMNPQQLFPEKWETMIKEKEKRDSMMAEIDQSIATTMFKCPKCNQCKTTYYELQTRSSDESASCFITCLVCSWRWKKN